jgi:5-hydroxyisourate hydrolase
MKSIILACCLALGSAVLQAADFQLSTHVLDTSSGSPGPGVKVLLEKRDADGNWKKAGEGVTDKDGRIKTFLEVRNSGDNLGTYRLTFGLEEYFEAKKQETVFPEAVVVFKITDASHYHIPVVVTPFAISTYRGS